MSNHAFTYINVLREFELSLLAKRDVKQNLDLSDVYDSDDLDGEALDMLIRCMHTYDNFVGLKFDISEEDVAALGRILESIPQSSITNLEVHAFDGGDIDVTYDPDVVGRALSRLTGLTLVHVLDLDVAHLCNNRALDNLKTLSLAYPRNEDNGWYNLTGMCILLRHCPNLENLELSDMMIHTERDLRKLVRVLRTYAPKLNTLELSECLDMDGEYIDLTILATLPNLRILKLISTHGLDDGYVYDDDDDDDNGGEEGDGDGRDEDGDDNGGEDEEEEGESTGVSAPSSSLVDLHFGDFPNSNRFNFDFFASCPRLEELSIYNSNGILSDSFLGKLIGYLRRDGNTLKKLRFNRCTFTQTNETHLRLFNAIHTTCTHLEIKWCEMDIETRESPLLKSIVPISFNLVYFGVNEQPLILKQLAETCIWRMDGRARGESDDRYKQRRDGMNKRGLKPVSLIGFEWYGRGGLRGECFKDWCTIVKLNSSTLTHLNFPVIHLSNEAEWRSLMGLLSNNRFKWIWFDRVFYNGRDMCLQVFQFWVALFICSRYLQVVSYLPNQIQKGLNSLEPEVMLLEQEMAWQQPAAYYSFYRQLKQVIMSSRSMRHILPNSNLAIRRLNRYLQTPVYDMDLDPRLRSVSMAFPGLYIEPPNVKLTNRMMESVQAPPERIVRTPVSRRVPSVVPVATTATRNWPSSKRNTEHDDKRFRSLK